MEDTTQVKLATDASWVSQNIPTITSLSTVPQRWLIDRLLLYGGVTMIAGAMGTQKSLLGMYIAKALSGALSGRPLLTVESDGVSVPGDSATFLGRKIAHGVPVLYIDRENPESTVNERREKLGILGSRNFHYWGEWNKDATPDPDDKRLVEFAERDKGLILFDSFQDWYGNRKEVDNSQMIELMNKFKRLARLGSGVVLFHHDAKPSAKGQTQGYRGGTSIPSLADMSIKSKKSTSNDGSIILEQIRFRQCGDWQLTYRVDFRPNFWELTLRSDMEPVDMYNAGQQMKQSKADNKASDLQTLIECLTADPTVSIRRIGERTGIDKGRAGRLLKDAGWTRGDDQQWTQTAPTDPAAPTDDLPF